MPEIKNTFTQGKMNKDLDERIVPDGQYRDALNIQVSTSDGADVGTVQNILGNTLVNPSQFVSMGSDFECIGSVADERNNTLYYFITDAINSNVDAIIQYKKGSNTATPVLVDRKAGTSDAVLKFSNIVKTVNDSEVQGLITAINIIDDILLWTDGVNEPRKINITNCINGSTNYLTDHTQLNIDGVDLGEIAEEHITVIKKNPLRPLSVKINDAPSDTKAPLFEKIFPRFSYRYRYTDGEYSTYAPFTDVVFKSKYVDTEDSTGGLVFYNDKTAYDTLEPYNAAMRNWIDSIELYDFVSDSMPKDVVQVDILYKQEDSPIIYVLEIIKNSDSEWIEDGIEPTSSYNGKFIVKSENIYAALPENQTLRPWDNVPKTALAQEVTGNRVVYGNYTQAYDLGVNPRNEVGYTDRYVSSDFTGGGLRSLKAQRNYQLGVVYGDAYGRETPVFTNSNASLALPWKDANGVLNGEKSTQLTGYIENNHPNWASYYKFFVKETSGEYYNLVMSALYNPTLEEIHKDEHSWISFASSDRNKVSKDDYIIFKKITQQSQQIYKENKYRILDVRNEAPDAIKYKYISFGSYAGYIDDNNNISFNSLLFDTNGKRPSSDVPNKELWINKGEWLSNGGTKLTPDTHHFQDLYFSFFKGDANNNPERSSKYKIAKVVEREENSKTIYDVMLTKPITTQDKQLCTYYAGN